MKKRKSLFYKTAIGAIMSSFAILPIAMTTTQYSSYVDTNTNLVSASKSSIQLMDQINNNSTDNDGTNNDVENKSYITIKSMDDANITEKEKESIRRLYKNSPSQITANESIYDLDGTGDLTTLAPASIFHLLEFDTTKVYGLTNETVNQQNAPRITNLSDIRSGTTFTWTTGNNGGWLGTPSQPDSNLSSETPIPYLVNTKGETEAERFVTQKQLDELGLLFLRVDMKDINTSQPITEFITISGFRSTLKRKFLSSKIDLPGAEYKKNVNQITNSDLINYPQFDGVYPSQITLTSRTNNSIEGTLNYSLLFNFEASPTIKIDETNKNSSTVLNRYESATKTIHNTNYHQEFVLKGFIKAPNISNNDIVIILASIIASGVGVCILVYLVSLVTRKIRFMKKM